MALLDLLNFFSFLLMLLMLPWISFHFFLTFHIIKIKVKHDDVKELIFSFSSKNNMVLEHVLVENISCSGLIRNLLKEQNNLARFHSCVESQSPSIPAFQLSAPVEFCIFYSLKVSSIIVMFHVFYFLMLLYFIY